MAPPKGKKLWRKLDVSEVSVSVAAACLSLPSDFLLLQVENYIEASTHQERRGPAVESVDDAALFFVDTVRVRPGI